MLGLADNDATGPARGQVAVRDVEPGLLIGIRIEEVGKTPSNQAPVGKRSAQRKTRASGPGGRVQSVNQ